MNSNREYLEYFREKLLSAKNTEAKSLNNVHCKGLFSLVIAGTEHGR